MTILDTQHTDLIHDAQTDYFGKRIATCSSDRSIRIFSADEEPQTMIAELKGHEGPVWQIAWAHPNYGSILASASFDGKVIIWKEESGNWVNWHEYSHKSSVNGVSWAPYESGLVLASALSDGSIFLHKNNEGNWNHVSIEAAHKGGVNSVSWCPSATDGISLVSGGCDNSVKIWRFSGIDLQEWQEKKIGIHDQWVRDVSWAPNLGLSQPTIASGSQDGAVKIFTLDKVAGEWKETALESFPKGEIVWRVSWSITGNLLAVSSGDNKVTLWKESLGENGENWHCISQVDDNGNLVEK